MRMPAEEERGGHGGHRPGRAPICVYARRRRCPSCRPPLRATRGPDGLALFFFLRLGGQTRLRGSAGISGTQPARVYPARRPASWRDQKKGQRNMGRTQHYPKTDVVVAVVGLIPVAVSTARILTIVVPRAAAQHLPRPPGRLFSNRRADDSAKNRASRAGVNLPRTLPRSEFRVSEVRATEIKTNKQGQNATLPENRRCRCGCREDPCRGKHSAHPHDRRPTSRRAALALCHPQHLGLRDSDPSDRRGK